ncbi:MAG: rubredoxin [Leptospirales bacterium]|nr:rubredoxin [Leptospirales bacterium]
MPLRINLEITEQSESGYEFKVRQSGALRSLLPAIAFAEGTWRRPDPRPGVPVENNLICPDCETAYIPEYGDPGVGILPGTSLDDLPEDYCCSVCGYLFRPATQRLVTEQVA